MKKIFLLLILLIFSYEGFPQQLTLKDIPLTWKNYQHVNDKKRPGFTAVTASIFNSQWRNNKSDSIYQFTIKLEFNPKKSWVRKSFLRKAPDTAQDALLNHEKCHYVIALIAYQKMRLALQSLADNHTYGRADSIYRAVNIEKKKRDRDYDLATQHSRIKDEQKKWETLLVAELNELYVNEIIVLNYENGFSLVKKKKYNR